MGTNGPAKRPCASCPYRCDAPSGLWHPDEYAKLPDYDRETFEQPDGVFLCHQTSADDPRRRMCAGWVNALNNTGGLWNALAIRIGLLNGSLDEADVEAAGDYKTDVAMLPSGAAAYEHGMRDVNEMSHKALAAATKIAKKRSDVDCTWMRSTV